MTSKQFVYISDLHVDEHIFATFGSYKDTNAIYEFLDDYCRNLGNISYETTAAVLIAGDIADSPMIFRMFLNDLQETIDDDRIPIVVVLGNHELWMDGSDRWKDRVDDVADEYAYAVSPDIEFEDPYNSKPCSGFSSPIILHNSALVAYTVNDGSTLSTEYRIIRSRNWNKIRNNAGELFPGLQYVIYGGIGYSPNNPRMNALSRMYMNTIQDRKAEKKEAKKFLTGLHRCAEVFSDDKVICLAHMPVEDWIDEEMARKPYVYVTGHTHKNKRMMTPDGTFVLADNQVVAKKHPSYKAFTFEGLDKEYEEGINK